MNNLNPSKKNAQKNIFKKDGRRTQSIVKASEEPLDCKTPPQPEELIKSIVLMIRSEFQMDEPHCCGVKKLRIVGETFGAEPTPKAPTEELNTPARG